MIDKNGSGRSGKRNWGPVHRSGRQEDDTHTSQAAQVDSEGKGRPGVSVGPQQNQMLSSETTLVWVPSSGRLCFLVLYRVAVIISMSVALVRAVVLLPSLTFVAEMAYSTPFANASTYAGHLEQLSHASHYRHTASSSSILILPCSNTACSPL